MVCLGSEEIFFTSVGPGFDLVPNMDVQADAIIGCFRFLEGFFLLLVTKKRFQGTVCGEYEVIVTPFLHIPTCRKFQWSFTQFAISMLPPTSYAVQGRKYTE